MFKVELLTEAGIEPLPAISSNLSIFLVPLICPFTFQLPALDNLGPKDMDDLSAAYGPVVVKWARTMLIAHQQGSMALDLYNHLESQDLLTCYLGSRASDVSPYVNKQGPCLSAVSCASSSHPEDYQTLLSRLGGAAVTVAIPPPVPVQQYVVQSSNEKKEINNMATGYNTLITIMICANYDPNSNVLSILKFPKPTEAFKRVSKLTTKDERVRALKNMIDTNNLMRAPGSERNMLVMMRDYDDVDTLVPTAIISGIYAKTEIKDMKSASTQFTLIHFHATGKDTAITLRKERSAYQLEDALGETKANKLKKRATFSSTEMFVDLDLVGSYLANVISALQCMFNCASAQALSHPLLYNCIMMLFNFITGRRTKDWFKDHGHTVLMFCSQIVLRNILKFSCFPANFVAQNT